MDETSLTNISSNNVLMKTILKGILIVIIYPTIVGIVVYKWNTPKPKLSVEYAYTSQTPYKKDSLGQLHLEYKESVLNDHFELLVWSEGSEAVKDLEVDLISMEQISFAAPTIVFDPVTISNRVLNKNESKERIYLKLSELPQGTGLLIEMDTRKNLDEGDIKVIVLGSGRRWSAERKEIVLKKNRSSMLKKSIDKLLETGSTAYADESEENKTKDSQNNLGSGIFIGGYDPVRLTNEIFMLAQKKGVLTRVEAEQLLKTAKEFQGGVSFGGINILKFDETFMNVLLQKGLITLSQGNEMLARSKKAGGVLLNGYNVIHLKGEILNALINAKVVTVEEAQSAIDKAKAPK